MRAFSLAAHSPLESWNLITLGDTGFSQTLCRRPLPLGPAGLRHRTPSQPRAIVERPLQFDGGWDGGGARLKAGVRVDLCVSRGITPAPILVMDLQSRSFQAMSPVSESCIIVGFLFPLLDDSSVL